MSNPEFPEKMKAVEITKDTAPTALVLGDVAVPDHGPDDVLVRVAASGRHVPAPARCVRNPGP